ncbi:TPA: hypothetical protein U0R95_004970, partial [Escherichia coli]|nr:hypothetical protein [Escherichia coli]
MTQAQYEAETTVLREELETRLRLKKAYYEKSDALADDWLNGARDALADYATAAADNAALARDAVNSVLNTTESSVEGALDDIIRGTESAGDALKNVVEDLGNAIISELESIAAKKIVSWVFGGTFGTATSGSDSLLSLLSGNSTGSTGSSTGSSTVSNDSLLALLTGSSSNLSSDSLLSTLTGSSSAGGVLSSSVSSLTGSGCCCCNATGSSGLSALMSGSSTGSSGTAVAGVSDVAG